MDPTRSRAVSCAGDSARARDLAQGSTWWLLWGLPVVLVALGMFSPGSRPWLWLAGMGLAGAACLANARRCGRRHCYVTGPVLLLGALASLANGLGLAALSWSAILSAVAIGCLLGCAYECARGRYAAARDRL